MTVNDLIDWMNEAGISTAEAQISVVVSPGAVPQVVEPDCLDMDEDGDVIIEL